MRSSIHSSKEIEVMSYTDFIAFIKETNRCPGGKDAIRQIVLNSFLTSSSRVLEVGSNTGFTSLEIARIVKCNVVGIDISKSCVKEACHNLAEDIDDIKRRVRFKVASAYDIPFKSDYFDLVMVGGATSFMSDKVKAVSEYKRVTKPWGFIAASQLFYRTKPPLSLLKKLNRVLETEIKPYGKANWIKIFSNIETNLELYYFKSHSLINRSDKEIGGYVDYFLDKPHLKCLSKESQKAIRSKWLSYLNIFNDNHKYLGYFVSIFRKRHLEEEPELFKESHVDKGLLSFKKTL